MGILWIPWCRLLVRLLRTRYLVEATLWRSLRKSPGVACDTAHEWSVEWL